MVLLATEKKNTSEKIRLYQKARQAKQSQAKRMCEIDIAANCENNSKSLQLHQQGKRDK